MTWLKRGLATFLALVALALVAILWTGTRWQAEALADLEDASLSYGEVGDVVEAQRRLSELDAFAPRTRERDAGVLLNPLFGLDGDAIQSSSPDVVVWWATRNGVQAVRTAEGGWLEAPESMPPADLSISAELMAYDHWDPASSGSYGRYVADPAPVPFYDAPLPYAVGFQTLAKLRLAQGLVDGDMITALTEVRHLAHLAQSGEQLVPTMIGVALLGIERVAYETAVEQGLIQAADWTPVAEHDTWLARRTAFAMTGIYLGYAPQGSVDRLLAAEVPLFSRCAAVSEAAWILSSMKFALGTPLAGEHDLSHRFDVVDRELAEGPCQVPLERQYWAHPEWSASMWGAADPDSPHADREGMRTLLSIPWIRSATVVEITSTGAEAWVSAWRKTEPPRRAKR